MLFLRAGWHCDVPVSAEYTYRYVLYILRGLESSQSISHHKNLGFECTYVHTRSTSLLFTYHTWYITCRVRSCIIIYSGVLRVCLKHQYIQSHAVQWPLCPPRADGRRLYRYSLGDIPRHRFLHFDVIIIGHRTRPQVARGSGGVCTYYLLGAVYQCQLRWGGRCTKDYIHSSARTGRM